MNEDTRIELLGKLIGQKEISKLLKQKKRDELTENIKLIVNC